MPTSPAQIASNRRNARKSTGPRTQAGKERSKRNGVSHGIFCNQLVLSDESQTEFDAFRTAFLCDLRPAGFVELMVVDRIVSASWKLRRLNRIEAMTLESQAHLNAEELKTLRETKEIDAIIDAQVLQLGEPIDEATREIAREEIRMERRARPGEQPAELKADVPILPTLAQGRMLQDPDSVVFERLARHAHRLELSIHRALKELRELQKRTQSNIPYREGEALYVPRVSDDEEVTNEGTSS